MRRRYLRNRARGNIIYPGLIAAWSAKGKTNDDKDRAILKDLTGNGHNITLNGFAFSEMSGYGGYNVKHNFTYTSNNRCDKIERLGYKLTFINIKENRNLLFAFHRELYSYIGCKIKVYVKGIPNGGELYFGDNKWIYANKDGIYEGNVAANNNGNVTIASLNCIGSTISVEFLPEYPDALVFDGVDDYGINENMPILTDYTIIAKRKTNDGLGALLSKSESSTTGAFIFEGGSKFVSNVYSFGGGTKVDIINSDISYQSKKKYNDITIGFGTATDTNKILLGKFRFWQGAFYSAYLFDRSLDEQEIKTFIRKYIDPEYLLPSEIPTPDCYYDFSKGSNDDENRETIKDYSGNGNDAVAHNFAWNEEGSGYKDGALYFDGVNDYVSLDAFDSGFKTIFMVCNPFVLNKILYEQRQVATINNQFAIYLYEPTVAYNARNTKGITYINSVLNNKLLVRELINKKQCITVFNNSNLEKNIPLIGTNINHELNEKMALYKFLGFKEALTEEQIQAVIKKYNLLDGIDKIEVN